MAAAVQWHLISLDELARRTGVHPATLRRWRDREGMPCYRMTATSWRVNWDEFREWVQRRRPGAADVGQALTPSPRRT